MSQEEPTVICRRMGTPQEAPITGWKQGDECRVDGKDIKCVVGHLYDARILSLSHSDKGIAQAELHITASAKGLDGKPIVQKWTHPKPIPTTKLRKALLK